jgi:hypothetical protein
MSEQQDTFMVGWWAENLDVLDREIARMASVCEVEILDPEVMRRVLRRDASVCRVANPAAFAKLHDLLMLHMAIRQKSVETVGEARTSAIEDYIIERIRKAFPGAIGKWPPG